MNSTLTLQRDIWVLLTEAPGDNDQCMALAGALGRPTLIKRLDWHATDVAEDRVLARRLLADTGDAKLWRRTIGLQAPWPRLVICCGRRSGHVAFWIKRQSGGYTKVVSIGRARYPVAAYDLLVAPPQFFLPERSNVINLALPLVRRHADDRRAANDDVPPREPLVPVPKPWFTILLGGHVKQFATSQRILMEVARRAQLAADRHGGSVVVSTSRRTPPAVLAAVESVLDRPHVYRWSKEAAADNPYGILLRQSAALFVTADSPSMILDCCNSGTPTYVIEYPERLDLRRRWRRDLYRHIRRTVEAFHHWGLGRAGDRLDSAQEWLHAHGILRYPRDLRQMHASVYEMDLARPVDSFDPEVLPARRIANDLTAISGIREVVTRCLALHGSASRQAAE